MQNNTICVFSNSYGYNANGEQTSRTLSGTAYTLAFNYEGQISSITQGASVVSFAYDAAERRVSRTASGTTTNFFYDGGQVLLEKQGSSTTASYTYGNALVRKDGEFPLFDGQGSERTVTNASQAVTGTLALSAFGQTVSSSGSSSSPYMYAATSGYRNDGDAGLSHVGARYYDAQVGRFISRDTYLDQKPYLYCEHDPVNTTDPSGHITLKELADIAKGKIGHFGVVVAVGAIIEDMTPPHSLPHKIAGTVTGVGTVLTGIGLVAAGATAAAPVLIVGGVILGTALCVGGVYHALKGWFE